LKDEAWLEIFHEISGAIRSKAAALFGTEGGRHELDVGAGGDITVEIDRAAEQAALAIFQRVHKGGERFSLLSEEAGLVAFGADHPLVVLDPIDGSLNAKQGIPMVGVVLSLLAGPTVASLRAGHVLNVVTGDSFDALRGRGATHNGRDLKTLASRPSPRIELLGLESSPRSLKRAAALVERAAKIRILGSMALSIAHTATGGFNVFCSPIQARVFDMTASLLVIQESGGVATDMNGKSLDGLDVGLSTRSTLLVASDRRIHEQALRILNGG
jgi:myo-inositol-1(or 4)-monophosphatase